MALGSAKVRRTILLTTLATTLVGGSLAWRGRQLADILDEQGRLATQLARLKRENAQARAERNALLSSPEAIEKVAREDYGFAAPGEQVTEFSSPPAQRTADRAAHMRVAAWQKVLMWPFLPLALPAAVFILTTAVLSWLEVSSRAKARSAA